MVRTLLHSVNPFILWSRLIRNRDPLTPDSHFRRDLEELLRPPQRPADPPQQYIANNIHTQPVQQSIQPVQQSTQPAQRSRNIPQGAHIKWVKCHLLPAGAQQGCPRVYWLHSVNERTLDNHISMPDIAVTALYWGHVDALEKLLDMTRPRVDCFFYNWDGTSQVWSRDWQFCIKREGTEVTVCIAWHAY